MTGVDWQAFNRVTDHRIGLTLHQLTDVVDGKLGPLVDAVVSHYEAERLQWELAGAYHRKEVPHADSL